MSLEVSGTVHKLGESITVSANYEKRELVVKTDDQYPQLISIEFAQGKCNEYLDKLKTGQQVTVSINFRGRMWLNPKTNEEMYFNTIQGWKVI